MKEIERKHLVKIISLIALNEWYLLFKFFYALSLSLSLSLFFPLFLLFELSFLGEK